MTADRSAHRIDSILAFDVGGHGVRAGLIDACTGAMSKQVDVPRPTERAPADPASAFAGLLRAAADALHPYQAGGIVVAAPGPIQSGRVSRLPTLFGNVPSEIDLKAIAASLWPHAPVWICNDLTAAGFAFVGQGHRDFLIATCGSGVGAKLFVDGKPLLGPRGMGGEIGHWQVDGFPPLACDCGGSGHLAALASGRGILRLARYRAKTNPAAFAGSGPAAESGDPERLDSRLVVRHFHEGDPWTVALVGEAADALACAFAAVHLAAATETFFITGGFGTALGPDFGTLIAEAARRRSWDTGIDWAKAVHVAAPDVEWGLVGAACYALSTAPENGEAAD